MLLAGSGTRGHLSFDALHKSRFTKSRARFEQMLHFDEHLVNGSVLDGEFEHRRGKVQRVGKIRRTCSFGSRIEEVRHRGSRPRSFDDRLSLLEKRTGEIVQCATCRGFGSKQSLEKDGLLA